MKKILLTSLYLSFVVVSFAQKTTTAKEKKTAATTTESKEKKPTKQETMDWIGGKMKENLVLPRIFVSYSKGVFVYKKEDKVNVYCTTTIDLNKLTGITNDYSTDFFVSGKILLHRLCPGEEYGTDYDNLSIGGPNYKQYSEPFNFKTDNDLIERLRKAFKALIEFNSAKKSDGEAF